MNTRENLTCFEELETERPQDEALNIVYEQFTRRTNDPKLRWLEEQLADAGIAHRRQGASFHAPILQVDADRIDDAWAILGPDDDIPDDDPRYLDWAQEWDRGVSNRDFGTEGML
ncbi:MAG: hypothetical protein E4H01_06130 [Lysobacterales bacterium]|nr:MAG: hypothetical protein E4H01_06130 [Xanthomonadales bacterium]